VTLAERDAVIFVGGTAFSGAELVGGLLGARRDVAAVPAAARFHSDPWGIPALLSGRIGLDDFVAQLRAHEVAGRMRRETLDAAIAALRDSYHTDPLDSCRQLFWTLIAELVDQGGAEALVEASPGNLAEAQTLARLVPGARFVHVVRDGRDVAAAACESDSGPGRMAPALEWWADGLREIERGFRGEEDGTPYAIPEERFTTVVLDELASSDRETTYRGLLDTLSLDEDESVRSSGEANLEAATIGGGEWHKHARGPAAWWLSRRYARTLGELEAEGNHAAPALLAAYGRLS
jgi:hypothetical protein